MLLLEYLLRRRDVGPSILLELHEPLERREILPLRLVVHDVGHVFLLDFFPRRSCMNSDRGHTYRPSGITNSDQDICVVRFHELARVAVRDHLQQTPFY